MLTIYGVRYTWIPDLDVVPWFDPRNEPEREGYSEVSMWDDDGYDLEEVLGDKLADSRMTLVNVLSWHIVDCSAWHGRLMTDDNQDVQWMG